MLNSRNLGFHLHRLAWIVVNEELTRGQIPPEDPWQLDNETYYAPGGAEKYQAGCLELLYVYTRMIKILQRRIDWTVNEALVRQRPIAS
jgi:hypothetical protein